MCSTVGGWADETTGANEKIKFHLVLILLPIHGAAADFPVGVPTPNPHKPISSPAQK